MTRVWKIRGRTKLDKKQLRVVIKMLWIKYNYIYVFNLCNVTWSSCDLLIVLATHGQGNAPGCGLERDIHVSLGSPQLGWQKYYEPHEAGGALYVAVAEFEHRNPMKCKRIECINVLPSIMEPYVEGFIYKFSLESRSSGGIPHIYGLFEKDDGDSDAVRICICNKRKYESLCSLSNKNMTQMCVRDTNEWCHGVTILIIRMMELEDGPESMKRLFETSAHPMDINWHGSYFMLNAIFDTAMKHIKAARSEIEVRKTPDHEYVASSLSFGPSMFIGDPAGTDIGAKAKLMFKILKYMEEGMGKRIVY